MTSSSDQPGFRVAAVFEREADMLRPLREHVEVAVANAAMSNVPLDSWSVLFEVPATSGIVDVLYVRFDQDRAQRRRADGRQPITNWNELLVFAMLQNAIERPLSLADLAVRTGLSPRGLRRGALSRLESSGHLVRGTTREWFRPSWRYRLPVINMVTVEAKRSDWRQAAAQASRHTTFADGSFLAVEPAAGRRAVEQRRIVSNAQLGVLAVDPATRNVTRLASAPFPSRQPRRALSRMFVAEQALKVSWDGGVSGPVQPVFGRMLTASQGPDPRGSYEASAAK